MNPLPQSIPGDRPRDPIPAPNSDFTVCDFHALTHPRPSCILTPVATRRGGVPTPPRRKKFQEP